MQVSKRSKKRPRCLVICPRCGKKGFLTARWVRKSGAYFPETSVFTKPVAEYYYYKDQNKELQPEFVDEAIRMMDSVRVFEFEKKEPQFDKKNVEDVYKYICTFDPEGRQ